MIREDIESYCQQNGINCLFADGLDDAIVGLGICFNSYKIIYDKNKVIEILEKDMSHEEAIEFFEFNIIGSYVGDETPVFLENLDVY